MDRRALWFVGILFGGLTLCLIGFVMIAAVASGNKGHKSGHRYQGGDAVGVVEVMGPISDSKRVLKDLKEFADSDAIKAVVVRIDSPGGAVGPSQEIYDALKALRAKKKVVASMGAMAASGGYYIAVAAEKIFANAGTLTGSIGVIMQTPNLQGVLKWAGVEMNTITSGKMKDSGSPFRAMTEDERAYFSAMLNDVHEQFIEAVAEGRSLKLDEVRPLADGRVYSGRQAKEAKLVDELGGLNAAVMEAGKLAGISGEPDVEYPHREKNFFKEMMGEEDMDSQAPSSLKALVKELLGVGVTGPQYRLPSSTP